MDIDIAFLRFFTYDSPEFVRQRPGYRFTFRDVETAAETDSGDPTVIGIVISSVFDAAHSLRTDGLFRVVFIFQTIVFLFVVAPARIVMIG